VEDCKPAHCRMQAQACPQLWHGASPYRYVKGHKHARWPPASVRTVILDQGSMTGLCSPLLHAFWRHSDQRLVLARVDMHMPFSIEYCAVVAWTACGQQLTFFLRPSWCCLSRCFVAAFISVNSISFIIHSQVCLPPEFTILTAL
jgi:hypothetical protein